MKKYTIPIIIPYSKEKKDWVFNNQKIINSTEEKITRESLVNTINSHIEKLQENYYIEVAFLETDFTNLDEDLQEELLDQLSTYIRIGKIDEVRVSIRPDNVTKKKLKMLKKYKVKTIELEIHSTNDYILKKIGMNYNFKDIKKASKMIRWYGFKLGHQMSIGLPDSTKLDDINTAKNLTKLKTGFVSINPVLVIKGTALEKEYTEKRYKPLAVVQALETCKELVKIFNEKGIEINAIGFEPLDSELEQKDFSERVIAGPFHPAFRQLVESSLWYDAIVNKIKKLNAKVMQVEVTVNSVDLNNVVGYKSENIIKFKETYDVDLIVTEDENMKPGKSKIEVTKVFDWGEYKVKNTIRGGRFIMPKSVKTFFIEALGTIVGSFIIAVSVSFFLLPNELSSGGFSGIATLLYYILKMPMGITILCLNIPLFIMSGFKIGKDFFAKSLIGTVSLSIFIELLDKFQPVTNDKMLASIYGGVLVGLGTAIILKSHSSTGGSDLLAILIKRYNKKVQVGRLITIIDAIIVLSNVILLKNIEIGLYSAITIYLMGLMIDIVFEGIFFSKLLFIISDKNEQIAREIETKIGRGITGLYGKGMYKNKDKLILMCAVSRNDIANIKKLIMDIDDQAFIIVTNSREVLGVGFKRE